MTACLAVQGRLCCPGDSGLTGHVLTGPGACGMYPWCPQPLGGGAGTESEQHLCSHACPVPVFHLHFILPFFAPALGHKWELCPRFGSRKSPNPWHRAWQLRAFIHLLVQHWGAWKVQLEENHQLRISTAPEASWGGVKKPHGQERSWRKFQRSVRGVPWWNQPLPGDVQGPTLPIPSLLAQAWH